MQIRKGLSSFMLFSFLSAFAALSFAAPAITGTSVIDAPPILKWEHDQGTQTPNFDDEVSNVLLDFHGNRIRATLCSAAKETTTWRSATSGLYSWANSRSR